MSGKRFKTLVCNSLRSFVYFTLCRCSSLSKHLTHPPIQKTHLRIPSKKKKRRSQDVGFRLYRVALFEKSGDPVIDLKHQIVYGSEKYSSRSQKCFSFQGNHGVSKHRGGLGWSSLASLLHCLQTGISTAALFSHEKDTETLPALSGCTYEFQFHTCKDLDCNKSVYGSQNCNYLVHMAGWTERLSSIKLFRMDKLTVTSISELFSESHSVLAWMLV